MTLCNTKNDIPYWENIDLKPIQEPELKYWFTSDFDTDAILRNKSPYSIGDGKIVNVTRTPVHQNNVFGSGLSFNGNGYVTLPYSILHDQKRFTLSSWFKTTNQNIDMRLYHEGSSETYLPVIFLSLNDSIPGEVKFGLRDNNGVIGSVSSIINTSLDGKWHNLTGLAETASMSKLFYDGMLVATNTSPTSTISTNTSTIGAEKRIGPYSGYFTGLLGETIVTQKSYTDAEIYYNYIHSPFYYLQQEEL